MREVGGGVARRHDRVVEADVGEGGRLEGGHVDVRRRRVGGQRVPRLIEP